MERIEIEGMLNRLGVKKDELSEQGKPLDELNFLSNCSAIDAVG